MFNLYNFERKFIDTLGTEEEVLKRVIVEGGPGLFYWTKDDTSEFYGVLIHMGEEEKIIVTKPSNVSVYRIKKIEGGIQYSCWSVDLACYPVMYDDPIVEIP